MASPSGKDPHGFVSVTEPVLAHPQRIPGRSRSHLGRPQSCGGGCFPWGRRLPEKACRARSPARSHSQELLRSPSSGLPRRIQG
jgi:hypothetical protein